MQKLTCAFASAAVLLASVGFASAQAIAVGNASFETPSATASPNFVQFPQDAAGVFGAWEQFGSNFKAVYQTSTYGGTLTNAAGSNGVDGTQAATIGAGAQTAPAVAGGIFQDLTNYTTPNPTQVFQAGTTYTLTVGVGIRADGTPSLGEQITLRLYYRTADQAGANLLAATPLTVGTTPGLNLTPKGVLTDYSVAYTVPAGSAAIGKPIGIFFDVNTPAGITGGDFALDNVRLVASVPEPTTVALLGLGVFGLGTCALRRRRRA